MIRLVYEEIFPQLRLNKVLLSTILMYGQTGTTLYYIRTDGQIAWVEILR